MEDPITRRLNMTSLVLVYGISLICLRSKLDDQTIIVEDHMVDDKERTADHSLTDPSTGTIIARYIFGGTLS